MLRMYLEDTRAVRKLILGGTACLALAVPLASCDTPVGRVPGSTTLVTNPDGNGPHVVRWGPPDGCCGGGG